MDTELLRRRELEFAIWLAVMLLQSGWRVMPLAERVEAARRISRMRRELKSLESTPTNPTEVL